MVADEEGGDMTVGLVFNLLDPQGKTVDGESKDIRHLGNGKTYTPLILPFYTNDRHEAQKP